MYSITFTILRAKRMKCSLFSFQRTARSGEQEDVSSTIIIIFIILKSEVPEFPLED